MDKIPDLTIISVYHNDLTKRWIELKWDFVMKLNSFKDWVWFVGDNSSPELVDKIDSKKFQVIPNGGPRFNKESGVKYWQSYDHASAINFCLNKVETRFVLHLDNDFFVVRPEWIRDVLTHMKKNDLAFFGAPYYPRDYRKERYFPTPAFCVLVDLEKIPLSALDYTPQFENAGSRTTKKNRLNLFNLKIREKNIGTSFDTGHKIFTRYYNDKNIRFECVQPVYNPFTDLRLASKPGLVVNQIFEYFLPDRLCYVPKKSSYYVKSGFRELGHFDARGEGWEEHMWQGEPFGFHARAMRSQKKGYYDDEKLISSVRSALSKFNE